MKKVFTFTATLFLVLGAWFFSVLIAALMVSLSLAGVAAAQTNTSLGAGTLQFNTTGYSNTASGHQALLNNTTGYSNTASGASALQNNTTGRLNTASGHEALQNNTTGTSTLLADSVRS